jgi:hypothetical protein
MPSEDYNGLRRLCSREKLSAQVLELLVVIGFKSSVNPIIFSNLVP